MQVIKLSARRMPGLFNPDNDITAASGMSFLDANTGNHTAAAAFTPAGVASQQVWLPLSCSVNTSESSL